MSAPVIDRRLALATPEPVPREEWEWLATHGVVERFAAGAVTQARGSASKSP